MRKEKKQVSACLTFLVIFPFRALLYAAEAPSADPSTPREKPYILIVARDFKIHVFAILVATITHVLNKILTYLE